MRTKTLNMSVPTELAEFVRQDMAEGHFGNMNEYFRDLLRRRRQARIEEDVRLLEHALAGAPAGDAPPEFYAHVKEIQQQIRQEKKACR
ncbi:MAG: hypothetical protein HY674_09930 [Chloroflexi bacterium]|nr:hypothetical protein [Chloroflexota bacterium]